MKEKSGFFKNTLILFTAMFITKIVGAVLKIPLTNMIGGTGMGYFSTAYSFFSPVYTVLAAGLPVIVTRMTAQSAALGRFKEARGIKSAALTLSVVSGIIGTVFMIAFAVPFSDYAANSHESLLSVLAISPSVLFCCLAAAYRGYYEGLSNMMPTALSQVLESIVKAVMGLGLAGAVLFMGREGVIPADKVLPYCAAAAVLGVTVGELCGTVFLMLRSRLGSDSITDFDLESSPEPPKRYILIKKIIAQSLPISLGAVIINLGSFIDLLTISGGIQECFGKNTEFFYLTFKNAINEAGAQNFGNFAYGSYTGIVLSVFMLITSLTALIGKSALPSIAAAYECGNKNEVKRNVSILLTGIFIIGLPLCLSLGVLAEPVLALLYPSRAAEISVSVYPLTVLCIGGIPIALCGGLFSVFQAIGRFDLPIKLMMSGSAAKLILNLLLLRIPYFSISGAAISTVLSHLLVMILGLVCLKSALGVKIKIFPIFVKPFSAAAVCCLLSLIAYYILFCNFGGIIRMLLTVCMGGLAYLLFLVMLDRRLLERVIRSEKTVQHL